MVAEVSVDRSVTKGAARFAFAFDFLLNVAYIYDIAFGIGRGVNRQEADMQIPTTARELADAFGDVDAEIKALEKRRDAIKAMIAKLNTDVFEGERYTLTRSSYVQDRLDTKRLAADLGDEILATYRTEVRCSRLTVRLALAVAA